MGFAAPIGISDFRKLRTQGRSYVDKTGCIARMLAEPAEVLLFPRPRRFGKTLLLSTLQAFVERGSDDRSGLFAGLAIWEREDARRHLARHPVISMTFKDVKLGAWDECLESLGGVIAGGVSRPRGGARRTRRHRRRDLRLPARASRQQGAPHGVTGVPVQAPP
ncbi:MAG TPA: AAA family ATPase [Haliangium sp.]|nr:AAA family ATPase [Haliangium sp.]